MSRFAKQLQKIPRDRKTLILYYAFFSIAWSVWILGYSFGYWQRITDMGGHLGMLQLLFFMVGLIVPLLIIWLPIYLTRGQRFEPLNLPAAPVDGAVFAPEQVEEINSRLKALAD